MIIRYEYVNDYLNDIFEYTLKEVIEQESISLDNCVNLKELGCNIETRTDSEHISYGVGVINLYHSSDIISTLHGDIKKGLEKDIRNYKIQKLLDE